MCNKYCHQNSKQMKIIFMYTHVTECNDKVMEFSGPGTVGKGQCALKACFW